MSGLRKAQEMYIVLNAKCNWNGSICTNEAWTFEHAKQAADCMSDCDVHNMYLKARKEMGYK
jgi:hypothetical protein